MQAMNVWLGELLVGEVGERGPRHNRSAARRSAAPVSGSPSRSLRVPSSDPCLELPDVDRVGVGVQLVARRARREDSFRAEPLERLSQVGDVDLDRMVGGPRWAVAPQQIDQPVDREDLPGVQQQDREERALFRRAQVGRDPTRGDLERTKEPIVHPHSPDGDRRLAMTW